MYQRLTAPLFALVVVVSGVGLGATAVTADSGNPAVTVTPDDGRRTAANESDGNATASNGTSLPFGLRLKMYISAISFNDTKAIGTRIAAWVLQHNPGNPPSFAGPPGKAGSGNETRGPPGKAGSGNETRGPPGKAGNGTSGNATAGNETGDNGGDPGGRGTGSRAGNGRNDLNDPILAIRSPVRG